MKAAVWLVLGAAPLMAEFHHIRIVFTPTGCVDCPKSLESRLAKTRGVVEVKVDPKGEAVIQLAEGNRARLELIRDFIEQGGEKIRRIEVEAMGSIEASAEGGGFVFVLEGVGTRYAVTGVKSAAAKVRVVAHTEKARPLQFVVDRASAE